jgi:succinate dehydrogenase / fumarate reductase membrane anchor subunit
MAFRSAIADLEARGSAHEGAGHWKLQRLTAIANVPLVLWFVISMVRLTGADYGQVSIWLGQPINTILMVLLVVSTFWHARLGIQVVLEDYVHHEGIHVGSLVLLNLGAIALAASCLVAILKVSLGS